MHAEHAAFILISGYVLHWAFSPRSISPSTDNIGRALNIRIFLLGVEARTFFDPLPGIDSSVAVAVGTEVAVAEDTGGRKLGVKTGEERT